MKLRIRDLREDSDLVQSQIAGYIGLKQQTYSRYERGELEPSLEVMAKLASLYHTSADYLIGLTDDKQPYPRSDYFNTKFPEPEDIRKKDD